MARYSCQATPASRRGVAIPSSSPIHGGSGGTESQAHSATPAHRLMTACSVVTRPTTRMAYCCSRCSPLRTASQVRTASSQVQVVIPQLMKITAAITITAHSGTVPTLFPLPAQAADLQRDLQLALQDTRPAVYLPAQQLIVSSPSDPPPQPADHSDSFCKSSRTVFTADSATPSSSKHRFRQNSFSLVSRRSSQPNQREIIAGPAAAAPRSQRSIRVSTGQGQLSVILCVWAILA